MGSQVRHRPDPRSGCQHDDASQANARYTRGSFTALLRASGCSSIRRAANSVSSDPAAQVSRITMITASTIEASSIPSDYRGRRWTEVDGGS